jgi:class 3 adenylate cyclase/tetratricopeptide (TPR) repeat protein
VPETQAERKLATVLFVDLTGFTALAASLDPEDVFSFIRPTMLDLKQIAEAHGGTVPEIQGDGFMALFGVPTTHEDDAERAVRAALACRDRVRVLNEGRSGLTIPETHSGVNSGEVMVGSSTTDFGVTVIGDVVNTASRLADLAPAGTVIVEEGTWRRTRHAIRYGPRRSFLAKGKTEPIIAFEARAPRTAAPVGRRTHHGSDFVDRVMESEELAQELRAVLHERRARVIVVSAEPGAGKTRLASEFTRRNPELLVLAGRATAYGQSLPVSPLGAAVAEIVGVAPGASTRAGLRQVRSFADRMASGAERRPLVRGLCLLLGIGEEQAFGSRGAEDAIVAARTVLEGIARERPVVVLLDDLQWADPAVVEALRSVGDQPWVGPILFLGLTRPDSLPSLTNVRKIELAVIPDEAMGELASFALGRRSVTPELAAIVARAGGNPLFLEECISMLVESGALVLTGSDWVVVDAAQLGSVPTTVRAVAAARLDGLPEDEKRLLQCASVSGELTWDRLLKRLAPEIDVQVALRHLVERDLLRRRRGSNVRGAAELVFRHALIRDVSYNSLPREERVQLHLEVAAWLGQDAGLPREPVDQLAQHYWQAWSLATASTVSTVPEGLARSASLFVGRWADETMRYQALAAETLYARAIEIDRAGAGEIERELCTRHAIGHAESLIELGRHAEAKTAATSALELAGVLADEHLEARALVALGRVESDVGDDVRARDLLDRALTLFRAVGDVSGVAWATHRLSEISTRTDYAEGLDYLRLAHRLFVEAGDHWGRVVSAQDLAYMLSMVGGPEFRRWYRECEQLAEGEGDLRSRAALLRTLGYHRYYCGEHEAAISIMHDAGPVARAAGDRYALGDALLIEALAAAAVSPPQEASVAAEAVVAFGRDIRSARLKGLGLAAEGWASLRDGDPRRATRCLGSSRRTLGRLGARAEMAEANLMAAEVMLDRGVWGRVSEPAMAGAREAKANGMTLVEPVGPLLVGRAALGRGDPVEASTVLAEAVLLSRGVGAGGTLAVARAARDQALLLSGRRPRPRRLRGSGVVAEAIEAENEGLVCLVEQRYEDATACLERAVNGWRQLGSTVWLARALAMLGEAHRQRGNRSGTASARSRARRVLVRLDAPAADRQAVMEVLSRA